MVWQWRRVAHNTLLLLLLVVVQEAAAASESRISVIILLETRDPGIGEARNVIVIIVRAKPNNPSFLPENPSVSAVRRLCLIE